MTALVMAVPAFAQLSSSAMGDDKSLEKLFSGESLDKQLQQLTIP